MVIEFLYIIFGYLCGSLLFARIFGWLIKHDEIEKESRDKNPGTANAFLYGGFLCGVLTLCGDLGKGFIPVYLYLKKMPLEECGMTFAFILAAPVVGHILPLFFHFKGGKGIATTFGCLLGLAPFMLPVLILAFFFIFFSVVVRVSPHYYRTIWVYLCSFVTTALLAGNRAVVAGCLIIALCVRFRMWLSQEEKERCRVNLLWIH